MRRRFEERGHLSTNDAMLSSDRQQRSDSYALQHFHHPVVGELTLSYNRLDLAADPG